MGPLTALTLWCTGLVLISVTVYIKKTRREQETALLQPQSCPACRGLFHCMDLYLTRRGHPQSVCLGCYKRLHDRCIPSDYAERANDSMCWRLRHHRRHGASYVSYPESSLVPRLREMLLSRPWWSPIWEKDHYITIMRGSES